MMRSAAGFGTPKSRGDPAYRHVGCAGNASNRQRPVLRREAPRPALADRIRTPAPQYGHQLAEQARARPGERGCPGRLRRRDHTSRITIIKSVTSNFGTALKPRVGIASVAQVGSPNPRCRK